MDALAQLLIEKGLITEQEFYGKLKKVQRDYEEKDEGGRINFTTSKQEK